MDFHFELFLVLVSKSNVDIGRCCDAESHRDDKRKSVCHGSRSLNKCLGLV